jgi:hypothetical protein
MHEQPLPLLPLILDQVPDGVRRALAQEGIPCRDRTASDAAGRFVLFDSRLGPPSPLTVGQTSIDIAEFAQSADANPFDALSDERLGWVEVPFGRRTIRIRCAAIQKRALRHQALQALRDRIERAGGIWLRVAVAPYPYRSLLSVRLDHPSFDAADFVSAMNAVSPHGGVVSHYLAGEVCATPGVPWTRLKDADIGILGYRFEAFREIESLVDNLQRGLAEARNLGFEPTGVATAPGTPSCELMSALEWLGFSHHSGFDLAYDESPWLIAPHDLVQIPIHPISLTDILDAGSLAARASHSARSTALALDMAAMYYCDLIRSRVQTGEPVVLHGSCPGALGRYSEVLERILGFAKTMGGLWQTTLSGLAAWWQARSRLRLTVLQQDDGRFTIAGRHLPSDYRVAIEYCRGEHVAPMLLSGPMVEFSPEALAYENRKPRERSKNRMTPAERLRSLGHREGEIGEPGDHDEPGWASRTLGRWWAQNDKNPR